MSLVGMNFSHPEQLNAILSSILVFTIFTPNVAPSVTS